MKRYGQNSRSSDLAADAMHAQHDAIAELGMAVTALARAGGLDTRDWEMIHAVAAALTGAGKLGMMEPVERAYRAAFGRER